MSEDITKRVDSLRTEFDPEPYEVEGWNIAKQALSILNKGKR